MPLRGLFSKKNKSRTDVSDSTPASPVTAATESPVTSPTADYVKPDSYIPSSPNGRNSLHPADALSSPSKSNKSSVYPSLASSPPSSSKLRLPFGRRKAAKSSSSNQGNKDDELNPRPPFAGRLSIGTVSDLDASETKRNLGPPPSRSAIFRAYADPQSAHSTRSLPSEYPAFASTTNTLVEAAPKRPIFPWSSKSQPNTAKVKNKKSSPPKVEDISVALEESSSFNLKSFRHLGSPPSPPEILPPPRGRNDSTPDSANSSSASLVPPRPLPGTRSRNSSLGSSNDPSASQQRISVAAFREAQARRSLAGSPVPAPGARSPSPGPNLSVHHISPPADQGTDVRPRRTSMVALSQTNYSSDDDDSSENEDKDDSDTNRRAISRPGKSNTSKAKSKSEVGHGSYSVPPSFNKPMPPAFTGLRPDAAVKMATPRSRSDIYGQGVYERKTVTSASLTTEALISNNGASTSKTISQSPPVKSTSERISSDSDSDDSDNAPLAKLVPPKRPGSSASNRSNPQSDANSVRSTSNSRLRINSNAMPRPLIDINELTGPNKRPLGAGTGVKEKEKSMEGFTPGATLLAAGTTLGPSSVKSIAPSSVTSTEPPTRFISPPPSPPSSQRRPPGRSVSQSQSTSPQLLSKASAGMVQRRIPMGRKDTDVLSMTSSATGSSNDGSSGGGKKKDPLNERLSKVVAQSVGSPSASPTTPAVSNPLARPMRRGTAPVVGSLDTDLDIPFTSSPSPTIERPPLGPNHRRTRSSEIQSEEKPAARAPSPKLAGPGASIPTRRIEYAAQQKNMGVRRASGNSETMEDLADLLGAGIKLVSVNGEEQPEMELPFADGNGPKGVGSSGKKGKEKEGREESDTGSFVHLAYDEPLPSPDRITPIVVKTIPPTSSFAVTSRPPHARGASVNIMSSSSSGIVSDSVTGTSTTTTTTMTTVQMRTSGPPSPGKTRPRSSTLMPTGSSKLFEPAGTPSTLTNHSPNTPKAKFPPLAPSSTPSSTPSFTQGSASGNSTTSSSSSASSTDYGSGSGSEPSRKNKHREQTKQRPAAVSTTKPSPRSKSAVMSTTPASSQISRFPEPSKPFASSQSPASSTGGSSSGRGAPATPRDGSDITNGMAYKPTKEESWGSGVSGLNFGAAKHARKRSIAFEDEAGNEGKDNEVSRDDEARRRERRRGEARAAIELGNTINGPGPVLDDDDDEDLPISQTPAARMNTMIPMTMNGPMQNVLSPQITGNSMWGWPSTMSMPPQLPQMAPGQMLSPAQFMVPPPADPAFFAAHQQAMMYAKQAYQMAVAQQAMAAAAEEWDRGSTIGFSSSQSMYGMPPSVPAPMMGPPFGMGGNGWSTGSTIFPASNSFGRSSMYASGAMSEYGGGGGRGNRGSSSKSVYGESFGPPSASLSPSPRTPGNRARLSSHTPDSGYFPPVPPIPPQATSNKHTGQGRQSANPRARTVSQPASPRRHDNGSPTTTRKPPPSSWKTNGM